MTFLVRFCIPSTGVKYFRTTVNFSQTRMTAQFEWPRRSVLSSIALDSWPAPATVAIAPSLIYPSWSSERESREDLLDNLVLQAVEQKLKEDVLASLQESSDKPLVDQKQQFKPCQVRRFMSRTRHFCDISLFQSFQNTGYCQYGENCCHPHIPKSATTKER